MIGRYSTATVDAVALLARWLLVRIVRVVVVHLLVRRNLPLLREGFMEVRERKLLILRKNGRTQSSH
jgi:hypothetical protein